ncbi:MAG: ABC transporter transmembrane domain-containing protein [Eisenbergiella massiliensis]
MQKAVDLVNRIIQENLTAIRVVKSMSEAIMSWRNSKRNTGLLTTSERAFRVASLNMPAMQLVMYTTILCILWFGGRLILVGGMQVGELDRFLSYVLQVLNSLMMISNVFMMFTRSLTS